MSTRCLLGKSPVCDSFLWLVLDLVGIVTRGICFVFLLAGGFGGVVDLVRCQFKGNPLGVFLVDGIGNLVLWYFGDPSGCYEVFGTFGAATWCMVVG